jgi:hypothetical protein
MISPSKMIHEVVEDLYIADMIKALEARGYVVRTQEEDNDFADRVEKYGREMMVRDIKEAQEAQRERWRLFHADDLLAEAKIESGDWIETGPVTVNEWEDAKKSTTKR